MNSWFRSCHRRPRTQLAVEVLEERRVPTTGYTQLDLVSDQANTALLTDATLINAWGIAVPPAAAGGDFWVSDNGSNATTLYAGDVQGSPFTRDPLVVSVPFGAPTGQVFNGSNAFNLADGSPAQFLVAQETPWASGWNPGLNPPTSAQSVIDATANNSVYKGLALADNGTTPLLYLANFRVGTVEAYGSNFQRVTLTGTFTDPNLPAGFAPFNIAPINGQLLVTYARQNATRDGDVAGPGNGFVDVFNTDGTLVKRLISNGPLDSPWGLAVAPSNFGDLSGDLLVGNFGGGAINAFNPTTGAFVSSLNDAAGHPIVIHGLWGLAFGNGTSAGDSNVLYFSAGPGFEAHGLFGTLHANGTDPLIGTGTAVSGTAGQPLPGVLATFADATPGKTAGDFTVTITVDGQTTQGTATAGGSGFLVTGPATNPTRAGTYPVIVHIQENGTGGAGLTVTASATVTGSVPPPGGGGPTTPPPGPMPMPTGSLGQRFVTQVVRGLFGQAPSARLLERFAGKLDAGASAQQVALALVESFGGRARRAVIHLSGKGSTIQRAARLFESLVGHAPTAADGSLLAAVARKLGRRGNPDLALALVLGSPEYLARLGA
jgi:uncharacterized protein (TIGR03118 family)